MMVVEDIRKKCGPDFAIEFRLSGDDVYYVVEASLNNEAALFNVGDEITVTVIQPITENLIGTSDVSRADAEAPAEDATAEAEEQANG